MNSNYHFLLTTFLLFLLGTNTFAQSSIKMHLEEGKTNERYVGFTITTNKDFRVDYGDGVWIQYKAAEYNPDKYFNSLFKGTTITIEAQGDILEFGCENMTMSQNGDVIEIQNKCQSLDLSQAPLLEWINCSKNKLSTLETSTLQELERIDCNDNLIKSLDLSKNTKLHTLYAHRNKLTTINLSNNKLLEFLNLSNNDLFELDIKDLEKLINFQAYQNILLQSIIVAKAYPKLLGFTLKVTMVKAKHLNALFNALPDVHNVIISNQYDGYWKKKAKILGTLGSKTSCTDIAKQKGWIVDVVGDCSEKGSDTNICEIPSTNFKFSRKGNKIKISSQSNKKYSCEIFDCLGNSLLKKGALFGNQELLLPESERYLIILSFHSNQKISKLL